MSDQINHPTHYTSHPSGIECIEVVRHFAFDEGNTIKYLWRAGLKTAADEMPHEARLRDLKKARWYLDDAIRMVEQEIAVLQKEATPPKGQLHIAGQDPRFMVDV